MAYLFNNSTRKTPERFTWATHLLHLEPQFRVLEIGCGVGLWAEHVCGQLLQGKYVGIDRSAPLVKKAQKRNQRFIELGLASFFASDLKKIALPPSYFDAVITFNVNFFWQNASAEFKLIRQTLKATGKLFVFYQAPYEIEENYMHPVGQILSENHFSVLETIKKKLDPTSAVGLLAAPAQLS